MFARSQAPVAHTCNTRYSGGRDQEDHHSKPSWANSSQDSILKIAITYQKKGLSEWLKVKALSSSLSTTKKKKRKKERKEGRKERKENVGKSEIWWSSFLVTSLCHVQVD
jgi:hypothetical protein